MGGGYLLTRVAILLDMFITKETLKNATNLAS